VEMSDRDFLREVFLLEAWDTLTALDENLERAARSSGPADETLALITHRLKGAAALNGFPKLAEVAGEAEAVAERLGAVPPDVRRRGLDFLREVGNALKPALDHIAATGREDPEALAPRLAWPPAAEPPAFHPPVTTPAGSEPLAEMERFLAEHGDVLEYFKPEATEHLETMARSLGALERRGFNVEDLGTLFRAVHTLKGAAYTVGCTVMGDLAHRAEDLLGAIRDGRCALTPPAAEAMWMGLDALKLLLGGSLAPANANDAIVRAAARLAAVSAPPETVAAPPVAAGASRPLARVPAVTQAPEPAPSRPEPARPVPGPGASVRVGLDRLDALMNLVGELVIARSRLDRRLVKLERVGELLGLSRDRMARTVEEFEKKYGYPSLRPPRTAADEMPLAAFFGELEFDRYTDVNVVARMIAEISADVSEVHGELAAVIREVREDTGHVQRISADLRAEITRVRLVPVDRLFTRFAHRVNELARLEGKTVRLTTTGESVEVDSLIVEQLADPVTHLIRNAIAHGIESEAERRAAGKPAAGTIALTASQQGGWICVEVADDGRGIDVGSIRREAASRGFVDGEASRSLSDGEALDLIFLPGFSTAAHVTEGAGRGVGLDVVRTNVSRLGGDIEVETELGVGTRFILRVPLTVAITDALVVRVGSEFLAVPLSAVQLLLTLRPDEIRTADRGEVVMVAQQELDLIRLDRALGLVTAVTPTRVPIVVLKSGRRPFAVAADELVGRTDVVIKSLGALLEDVAPFAGATITGEGRVIFLLDPPRLLARWQRGPAAPAVDPGTAAVAGGAARGARVLVVDDSVSVRKFVGHMLARAGFVVTTASDGADALEQLAAAVVDVVVTDLEMPRVNGYELIKDLRRRAATRDVPVVVLTTRVGEKHLELARQVGAEHCVQKPVDEHTFVQLVRSLVGARAAEVA
jgi:chemotaxis protein histidine kinase CheA/ActR/RegA family two-component response regulator